MDVDARARFKVGTGPVGVHFDGRVIIIARLSIALQARAGDI
jgi:hypothetical protein